MHDLEHERNINKATADAHRLHHLRSLFLLQYIVDPCDFQEMKLQNILIVISSTNRIHCTGTFEDCLKRQHKQQYSILCLRRRPPLVDSGFTS